MKNMSLTNRILQILKYLWETTDEAHTASIADIAAHLTENSITADPRTIRKDIEQIQAFGIDVVVDRKVQNRYYIGTRHFETPEVKLLIDAVQSARFITPRKSKELIARLSAFVSSNESDILKRQMYVDGRAKATNENIYITVDAIQTAIASK